MRVLLLALCLLWGLQREVSAAVPGLVIILLPGTSLQDWQSADAPYLHQLMQTGAMAVMNTRTAHQAGGHERETLQSALLTLGAGSRAAGTGSATEFLPASSVIPRTNISAGDLYERRTGLTPPSGQSVCTEWPRVLSANANIGYDLKLGSLADTLTAQGVTVIAGGGPNSDWLAAKSSGSVRHVSALRSALGHCLVWDAGSDIAAADTIIGAAATQASAAGGRLIIISPCPSDTQYRYSERLTPVLVWGSGIPGGLLLSPSTRRPGLVTDTDFAPAVAAYFGIPRRSFQPLAFGYAWSETADPESVKKIALLESEAIQQARGMALLPYLAIFLGVWILVFTLRTSTRSFSGLELMVPLTLLVTALFAVSQIVFWYLLLFFIAVVFLLNRYFGIHSVLTILCVGLALALALDMVTGNYLMRHGLLGYSAIEGARYYGIGNEAMGLLIGAVLTGSATLWNTSKARRFILIVVMLGAVVLLGSVGAKAGGVLVSLAVLGTFLFTVSGRKWNGRTAALVICITASGMAVAAIGDVLLHPSGHSHIGEALERIVSGGSSEAFDIIRRKLAVEGRLVYHSAWAVLLWSGILSVVFLWKQVPPTNRASLAQRYAGSVGVATCLLLNDAGVIAAALFTVTLWSEAMSQRQSPSVLDLTRTEGL